MGDVEEEKERMGKENGDWEKRERRGKENWDWKRGEGRSGTWNEEKN